MTLDIVIVNWNTGAQLSNCIQSIRAANHQGLLQRVMVIDNGSSDDSAANLGHTNLPLTVVHNKTNRGFAAACNQGAKGSKADFILFLNPDTVLGEESLTGPMRFMSDPANRNVGITGIQLVDERGLISTTCSRFPTPRRTFAEIIGLDRIFPSMARAMRDWNHNENRSVDQIMGAFFLVRRRVFEELHGFDERFFVYYEEVDLSLRAHERGFHSYYLANLQAFHRGGGSSEQVKARRLFYSLRSRLLYAFKHFGPVPAIGVLLGTLLIEPFTRSLLCLFQGSFKGVVVTLEGYWFLTRALFAGSVRGDAG